MRSVAEDELNSTNFFSNVSFDPNSKIERPNHQFNSMINYKAHQKNWFHSNKNILRARKRLNMKSEANLTYR